MWGWVSFFFSCSEELRIAPDMARTCLCPNLRATGQCLDPNCRYAHSREERRHDPLLTRQLCKYYLQGDCLLGEACNFAHSMEKVKEATTLGEGIFGEFEIESL